MIIHNYNDWSAIIPEKHIIFLNLDLSFLSEWQWVMEVDHGWVTTTTVTTKQRGMLWKQVCTWRSHAILVNKCNAIPWLLLPIVVFEIDPDMTREGGSIPVTLTLQEATGKNVVLLPLGACDDGAHSQNEKMDRKNYIEGVSIVAYKRMSAIAF